MLKIFRINACRLFQTFKLMIVRKRGCENAFGRKKYEKL